MTTQILTTMINDKPDAFACVMGENIEGTVCLYRYHQGTILVYEINGLPQVDKNKGGFFGFHIHEGETCQNDTHIPYEKTLGHFNPNDSDHPFHLGDLPPLFATKGVAWGIVYIDKFRPQDVIDRTIVIHHDADDFHSQPSGHSGEKIACGKIMFFKN